MICSLHLIPRGAFGAYFKGLCSNIFIFYFSLQIFLSVITGYTQQAQTCLCVRNKREQCKTRISFLGNSLVSEL